MRTQPSHCESLQQSILVTEAVTPTRGVLVDAWTEAYGHPPPKGIGNRLLGLAVAYHSQTKNLGGLRPDTHKKLQALANPDTKISAAATPTVSPGMRLIREWRGESHIVDVLDDCILYRGKTFTSLSKVASHITGARWSGPRFFGIASK